MAPELQAILPPKTASAGSTRESSAADIAKVLVAVAGILTAILAGVAGLITAKSSKRQLDDFQRDFINQIVKLDNIATIKDRGGFLSSKDREGLGEALREQLRLQANLLEVRLHGKFAEEADLDRHANRLGRIERSLEEVAAYSDRIREAEERLSKDEESLYNLEKYVSQLRKTIDKQKLRRRELDDLKNRFPQLLSAAKDQK